MAFTTRPMSEADIPAVAALLDESYRFLAQRDAYSEEQLAGLLKQCASEDSLLRRHSLPHYSVFVAESEGPIVGYIALETNDIAELFVETARHGQGIGTTLLQRAEKTVRDAGHQVLTVHTATAPGFYEKKGMHIVETTKCAYGPLEGRPLIYLERKLPSRGEG